MRFRLLENLTIHKELNPKLFEDDRMKDDVRKQLLKIVKTFTDGVEDEHIPLHIIDVWMVGSNASYNYSNKSDIDIHIISNFDDIEDPSGLLTILYNYVKAGFNKDHDIKVKGHPVEVYIENSHTTAITNGIYSIVSNDWIKYPEPLYGIEDMDVQALDLYKQFKEKIEQVDENTDIDEIQEIIDNLYIVRQSSLAEDGEFGEGNLVFKEIRNNGLLDKLKNIKRKITDKELTLEQLEGKRKKKQRPYVSYGNAFKNAEFFNAGMGIQTADGGTMM